MRHLYDLLYSPSTPGSANGLKIFEIEVERLSAMYYQTESTGTTEIEHGTTGYYLIGDHSTRQQGVLELPRCR